MKVDLSGVARGCGMSTKLGFLPNDLGNWYDSRAGLNARVQQLKVFIQSHRQFSMAAKSGEPFELLSVRPRRLLGGNRWSYATFSVGLLFSAIQVVHIYEMLEFGLVGVVLESVIPLLFAAGTALTGPWLHFSGYTRSEQKRIVLWMLGVSIISGLLFAWSLSHQWIVADQYLTSSGYGGASQYASGGLFPHAEFVTGTNLTAGALLGLVLGVYNVRSRRHYLAVRQERERVEHQRTRLSVLNRVLRHNLRNDLNAVNGYAELLEEEVTDTTEYAVQIQELASALISTGEKARKIEGVVSARQQSPTAPIGEAIEQAVDEVREAHADCRFSVSIDNGAEGVNGAVLTSVVRELVENACRHNDAGEPRVTVETTTDGDDRVFIRVSDNGPGIPEHELTPLKKGTETALEHGSGLGLWLVDWGVATLGGEIEFESNEPRGTVATVGLPSAR